MNHTRIGSAAAQSVALPAVVAMLLAGCAGQGNNSRSASNTAIRCDEAVAQGVGFGQGQASAVAVSSLRNQIGDVRGYLVSHGVRHVRPADNSVTCRPHAFGGGLVRCTAVTRFCGR